MDFHRVNKPAIHHGFVPILQKFVRGNPIETVFLVNPKEGIRYGHEYTLGSQQNYDVYIPNTSLQIGYMFNEDSWDLWMKVIRGFAWTTFDEISPYRFQRIREHCEIDFCDKYHYALTWISRGRSLKLQQEKEQQSQLRKIREDVENALKSLQKYSPRPPMSFAAKEEKFQLLNTTEIKKEIAHEVQQQSFSTLYDAVMIAMEIERRRRRKKNTISRNNPLVPQTNNEGGSNFCEVSTNQETNDSSLSFEQESCTPKEKEVQPCVQVGTVVIPLELTQFQAYSVDNPSNTPNGPDHDANNSAKELSASCAPQLAATTAPNSSSQALPQIFTESIAAATRKQSHGWHCILRANCITILSSSTMVRGVINLYDIQTSLTTVLFSRLHHSSVGPVIIVISNTHNGGSSEMTFAYPEFSKPVGVEWYEQHGERHEFTCWNTKSIHAPNNSLVKVPNIRCWDNPLFDDHEQELELHKHFSNHGNESYDSLLQCQVSFNPLFDCSFELTFDFDVPTLDGNRINRPTSRDVHYEGISDLAATGGEINSKGRLQWTRYIPPPQGKSSTSVYNCMQQLVSTYLTWYFAKHTTQLRTITMDDDTESKGSQIVRSSLGDDLGLVTSASMGSKDLFPAFLGSLQSFMATCDQGLRTHWATFESSCETVKMDGVYHYYHLNGD